MNDIQCPNCQTSIAINTEEFLVGKTFVCSNCDVTIGKEQKTDLNQEKLDLFKKFTKTKKERTSTIPCPDCGTAISFTKTDIKNGTSVACSGCKTAVAF